MNKIHSCIVVAYDNILVFSTPIHHQNIEKIDRNAHVYMIRWSIQLIWLVRLLLYVLGSRTNKRMIFRVPHTSCAPIPFPMASDLFGRILKRKMKRKKQMHTETSQHPRVVLCSMNTVHSVFFFFVVQVCMTRKINIPSER